MKIPHTTEVNQAAMQFYASMKDEDAQLAQAIQAAGDPDEVDQAPQIYS